MKTFDLTKEPYQFNDIWFSADPHFNHENALKYFRRPFLSVDEMNKNILKNYNDNIAPDDLFIILGDFASSKVNHFRNQIACKNVWLITGNHDENISSSAPFQQIESLCKIIVNINNATQKIILCHYAMRTWEDSHRGSYSLYGHTHGAMPDDPETLSLDAGVDVHNYCALNLNQIESMLSNKKKNWIPEHIRWAKQKGEPFIPFKKDPSLREAKWTE